MRGGDVEEDELVGALGVVARGELDRVAGVAEVDEVDALDHAAVVHVEAGDDALESTAAGPASAAGGGHRVGERERLLVERPAHDHADDVRRVQPRQAATGRRAARRRPSRSSSSEVTSATSRRLQEVGPAQHAVAAVSV